MDENDQKAETTERIIERDDVTIMLELQAECRKLMKRKVPLFDPDNETDPSDVHLNYINA